MGYPVMKPLRQRLSLLAIEYIPCNINFKSQMINLNWLIIRTAFKKSLFQFVILEFRHAISMFLHREFD